MKITIQGVPLYDGDYPCGAPYTAREWRVFKQIGGIMPMDLEAAVRAADVDVIISYAVIGIRRRGLEVNEAFFLDFELEQILKLDFSDEDDDAVPPPQKSADTPPSSGASGSSDGDPQASSQNGTGDPLSPTGSTSDQETSAT